MNTETISRWQGASTVALFMIGSSIVLGIARQSGQDSWIAFLAAIAAILPVGWIYARLLGRYPGKGLFEICIAALGPVLGRVLVALYAWYALHLGSMVLRNYSEFIQITTFNQMPQTVSMLALTALVIWVVRRGVEALGRWSTYALPLLLFILLVTAGLLAKDMHISYLLPVSDNLPLVPKDALSDFTFPLGETVLLLCVLGSVRKGGKPGRAWLTGVLIGSSALMLTLLRNNLVLGHPMHEDAMFPSFAAVSVIIAGNFLSRIENVVGANLLLAGFVKISVCLLAASKGVAALLGEREYRPFAAPLGLLMAAFAGAVYKSTMEMIEFVPVYPYYAFPFQVIFPVLLCVVAEVRFAVKNKKEKQKAEPEPEPAK